MIEAVMIWNEPNNKSHWDPELDPDWSKFSEMVKLASTAVRAEAPVLTKVLGGISPIDATFIQNLAGKGVLEMVDAVAVHGFPLDRNHWPIPMARKSATMAGAPASFELPAMRNMPAARTCTTQRATLAMREVGRTKDRATAI